MTRATHAVREQGFQPLHCDIPAELTIDEYRDSRRRPSPRRARRRRLAGLLRR
jgi:hypothetical protein